MNVRIHTGYLLFLSFVAALGGLLFGYDTAVISGTISLVQGQFGLDVMQQGWYVGCALIGSIGGVAIAGVLSDMLGRKYTMLISAVLFTLSAVGCALCDDFQQLVVYRIIGGVGIGVVSIVSPLYISEIAVARYRGMLVSLYQLAITIGFLLAYFFNYQLMAWAESVVYGSEWLQRIFSNELWRGMLGLETAPAFLFLIIILVIPESPRWLLIKGCDEKACRVLRRFYKDEADVKQQVTDTKESLRTEVKSEWRILFEPGIRKAVLIGAAIAILGQFMGVNAVLYYGPTIFQDAGISSDNSLFCQVLVGMVNMLTTVLALFIIDKVGRKTLVYYGVSGMIVSLLLIGGYFTLSGNGLSPYWLLTFFLFYVFCCAGSISAVIFVFLSEMFPNKVRGIAMSIAGFSLWIGTYLIGQLTPWMLQNLTPQGTFFLFAFMCIPYMLIVWKLMPETTGKTLEEIERFWTNK